jgi:hypothetical protein
MQPEAFVGPMPQDDFVGPLKPQDDFVGPLKPEAFVGPMPEDDSVGPLKPEQTEIAIAEIEAISELRDSSKTSEAHLAAILAELIKSNTKSLEDYEPGDAAPATPTRTMAIPGLSGTSADRGEDAGAESEGGGGGLLQTVLGGAADLAGSKIGSKILKGGAKGLKGLVKGAMKLGGKGLMKLGSKGLVKGVLGAGGLAAAGMATKGSGMKMLAKIGGKALGKSAIKKIPIIGALAGLGFGASRAMDGDWLGAAGEVASGVASIIPGVGTAGSVAIDAALAARDYKKEQDLEASAPEPATVDSTATKVENATSAEDLAKEAAIATAIEEERIRSEKAGAAPAPQVATVTTNTQVNTNNTTVVRPDIRNQEPSWMRQESNRYGF